MQERKMRNRIKYNTGFSNRALLKKESDIVFNNIVSPEQFMLGEEIVDSNIMPVNSEASKKRTANEITKRIKALPRSEFIEYYKNGTDSDKTLVLFYGICRTYQLIPDFILDTVLKKWQNMDYEIALYDFKSYIYKLSDQHPELARLSQKNINDIAITVIKILKELGILNNGKLVKAEFNHHILKEIANNGDSWLLEALLLNETERQEIVGQ